MHALNTASYVSINKAMLSVDHVRQHIFSVYQIDLQADSDFHSENLINSSYKRAAWRDQELDADFSSFLSEIQFS